jgi:hypothetical protein
MHRMMTVFSLALSALLAGCFASQRPMFAPESAVRALGDGGRYASFEQVDGKDKPSDPIVVRPRSDGSYDFVNEKDHATPVTLHAIAGGLHVAQVRLAGTQGYGYVLLRVSGNEVLVVPAECGKQDATRMRALGVELRGRLGCWIDDVQDVPAFFTGLTRSEPVSKMVRD